MSVCRRNRVGGTAKYFRYLRTKQREATKEFFGGPGKLKKLFGRKTWPIRLGWQINCLQYSEARKAVSTKVKLSEKKNWKNLAKI